MGEDLDLAIEKKLVAIFTDLNMRQLAGGGPLALNRKKWSALCWYLYLRCKAWIL